MGKQIVAFSGGKDSTAMAVLMAERGEDFELLFTPTGNELPELFSHMDRVVKLVNRPLVTPPNKPLDFWIETFNALPNWRQRWCTRLIKIEPCIAYLEANPGSTLMVGLRADEELREGLFGPYAEYRYPLREMGMGLPEVLACLRQRGIKVPKRTDCALCYGQRLAEWYALWRDHPDEWAKGEAVEDKTGFTFRSPGRDTWPAAMRDLRAEFEKGRRPKGVPLPVLQSSLFGDDADEDEDTPLACRVCRL